MKLIIREYLGMIRESGEFDVILPDLLTQMGIIPLTKAQIGARQAGVDLPAVGNDENGKKILWLFVIKRGDIGRNEWSSTPQSVRHSLDEIDDIYIRSNISSEYNKLPIKIVVVTTGDFKQVIEQNWAGYTDKYTTENKSYEFWSGDKVAALIDEYLLDEYILPASARSYLRRALALVGEPDYDLKHYYSLLNKLLTWDVDADTGKVKTTKKCIRSIRTANLALAILCRWSSEDGNIKNAVIACERTLLWEWNAIRKSDLSKNKKIISSYQSCIDQYMELTTEYVNKVQPYLHVENSLSRYYSEASLLRERVYEEIGILATIAVSHLLWGQRTKHKKFIENTAVIADILRSFLVSHKCSASPVYDEHSIEISITLMVLIISGHVDDAESWLNEISSRLNFCLKANRWFPICTDKFDDLIEFEMDNGNLQLDKLKEISTLVPTLAQWAASLGLDELYTFLYNTKKELLADTCCQLWYPDEATDEFLYFSAAHYESGISEAPISLPETAEEMRENMLEIVKDSPVKTDISSSASRAGISWLDFIASRHFRTPLNPLRWQRLNEVIDSVNNDKEATS